MGTLRLALALTIVLAHSAIGAYFWLAVIVVVKAFFVISGFYMALILSTKYENIRIFYLNRFLRLYPTYLAVLLLSIGCALLLPSNRVGPFIDLNRWETFWHLGGHVILKAAMVLSNLSMVGIETTLYGCVDLKTGALSLYRNGCGGSISFNNLIMIPQAWSVSVEIAFYAIAPWVVRASNRTLAGLIGVGILARIALIAAGLQVNPWYRSTIPLELVYFFVGVALYRCYRHFGWRFLNSGAVDRWLGELSYPIYITHIFVMGLLGEFGTHSIPVGVGATLVFSAACVVLITEPIDRIRARLATPAACPPERLVSASTS